jgi:hypothetical protein
MGNIFEKLNLGRRQEIVVLQAPENIAPELARAIIYASDRAVGAEFVSPAL